MCERVCVCVCARSYKQLIKDLIELVVVLRPFFFWLTLAYESLTWLGDYAPTTRLEPQGGMQKVPGGGMARSPAQSHSAEVHSTA